MEEIKQIGEYEVCMSCRYLLKPGKTGKHLSSKKHVLGLEYIKDKQQGKEQKEQTPYNCYQCDKTIKTIESFRNHIKTEKHKKNKYVIEEFEACSFCKNYIYPEDEYLLNKEKKPIHYRCVKQSKWIY